MPQDKGDDLANTKDQPNVEDASKHDWFKKPKRSLTPDRDWNAGKQIDFRPPQTWISKMAKTGKPPTTFDELMSTPINFSAYYLKGGSSSRKYITSTTKTKEVKYDNIEGIEDMVPTLWSPVKVAYDKHVVWENSHWEGDFPRLNLRDIEDMLLLLFKKKLSNLERYDIFDLNVALRMFTKRVVILKRVEDLQLGVESYQKKLNITRPETFRSDITKMTPFTTYNNPQGIIYQDKFLRNRLMRSDEFCDDTLLDVRRVLYDIASSLEMDYLPKRR
ncbi:hypothetical protein Tco_1119345 [Tanacetum coccineum]